jgi:hypothetical protein
VVQETSAKFGLHESSSARNEELISVCIVIRIIYLCIFLYIMLNKNVLMIIRKQAVYTIGYGVTVFTVFVQSELVM